VLEDLKQKQDAKSSFFSQVILCSRHMPFRYDNLAYEENRNLIPEEYWLPIPENKELANSKTFHYLNALHYVDAQIGIFLENAAAEGLLDNTIVLLYGDHLGLHKYYPNEAESIAEEYPEYAFVNQSTFNSLPLIIYDPSGTLKGKSFDLPGGQTDIMPTLLYLLGIDQREYPFAMGKNLLNTQRRYTVISNGTVIGTVQDEESVRNILLMYKISETLIKQDYFGYLVEDLRKEEPLPEK
jgi:phosphoglycerol transferase MdoB-like AlkP superfamily enzyme